MGISILGMNIKKIREERELSGYKLAKMAGVGATTISEIETGKRQSLNTSTCEKIACALEISTNDLFKTQDEIEYEVTDIEQIINIIVQSEELSLDDAIMSESEKEQFKVGVAGILEMIKLKRK